MSLRSRISVFLFVVTGLVVVLAGVAIHRLTEHDIRNAVDKQLSTQLMEVARPRVLINIAQRQKLFENVRTASRVDGKSLEESLDIQIPTLVLADGNEIVATEGYPDFSETETVAGYADVALDGEQWRILTKTFDVRDPAVIRHVGLAVRSRTITPVEGLRALSSDKLRYDVTIQVAAKRSSVSTTLGDFRQRFILIGALAAVLSALLGWLLGTNIVKPLARLGRHAKDVGESNDLSTRIPGPYGPPEVEALASEFNQMLFRLERSADAIDQALSSSRAFTSNVAHELRTPLTSIRTNLDLLRMHGDMDRDQREIILGSLIEDHSRLVNTIDSLRLLARGDLKEAGVFEEIDFADLMHHMLNDQQKLSPSTIFTVTMPARPPLLFAWREGVVLMLRNVIENARIHSRPPNGDHVTIDIVVTVNGEQLRVIIDDSGVGIPELERDHVTERFVRGSSAHGSGSGLGLALVRQQVELHMGVLVISSNPSGGARVSIDLPIVIG